MIRSFSIMIQTPNIVSAAEAAPLIRFRVKELIAEKEFQENRRITLDEVCRAVSVSRPTLSRIANERGYSTTTDVLDRLCRYFSCEVGELAVFIREEKM